MSILVIGYGNELRGDDALGPWLAAQVGEWRLPGVRARSLRQLTPELSQDLASTQFALFIDASAPGTESSIVLEKLQPAHEAGSFAHISHPGVLLGLTQALFKSLPEAWMLTMAAESFDFGASFSPNVQAGLPRALTQIRALIQRWQAV